MHGAFSNFFLNSLLVCLQIAEGALNPKRRSFVNSPSFVQLDSGEVLSPVKATVSETVVMRVESFGMKLAHQFPWNPAAAVAVGLALRRRFLSDPNMPSTYDRRKQIIKVWLPYVAAELYLLAHVA